MWHSHFKLGGPLENGLDKQNVQEELLLLSVNILKKKLQRNFTVSTILGCGHSQESFPSL